MAIDYYETLDVAVDATREEIKRAWRRRVRVTHPDTGGDAEEFRLVQEAWETLGDDQKRAAYDRIRIRQTSNPVNPDAGGSPFPSTFTQPGTYFQKSSTFFSDGAGERIRAEANKLFEDMLRRQRMQQEREVEIEELGQPLFPLNATQWGHRITRLYVEAMLWGTPYARVQHWKRIDIWIIRAFLLLITFGSVGALAISALTATSDTFVAQFSLTVMYTAFSDLVAVFFGGIALGIAWLYRWSNTLRGNRT